jgi:hypothetical protein
VYDEFDEWMEDEESMTHMNIPEKNLKLEPTDENKKDVITENEHPFTNRIEYENLLEEIRSSVPFTEGASARHFVKNFEENKKSNLKRYQFDYFVNDIYKGCKNHGIKPTMIIEWIQDLFQVYSVLSSRSSNDINNYPSYQTQKLGKLNVNKYPKEELMDDEINNEIPLFSQVSFFIEQKNKKVNQLVSKRTTIIDEIKKLREQEEKEQSQLSNIIKEEKKALSYLQWYSILKQELLDKFKIAIEEEFEAFAMARDDFKEYGYNTSLLIKEYKNFDSSKQQINLLREEIQLKQERIQDLLKEISNLEIQSYNYKQTINNLQELKQMDLGLKDLKQLNGLIREVSAVNGIKPSEAVTRFFKELEKNYDLKLGLESKINEMQNEYEHSKHKVAENHRYLAIQNPVSPNLVFLYSHGLTNDDITGITNLVLSLNNSYLLDYKSIKKDNTIYANTNYLSNEITDKKEFWKLIVQKFKDLNNINLQIEELGCILNEL